MYRAKGRGPHRHTGGVVRALIVAAAAAFCLVPAAHASTLIFAIGPTTPSGTNPAGPVDVNATFTLNTTAQTITVALTNLEDNPVGVSQLISGVEFTLGNTGSGGLTPKGVSESGGTYIDVSNFFGYPSVPTQPANQWHAASLGGSVLTLCTVCNPSVGYSNPQQELIGGPDPNMLFLDLYDKANSTIAGSTDNPFLLASGDSYTQGPLNGKNSAPVWVVQMPVNSLTATTTIRSVTFFFGDTYNAYSITDTDAITPEPATFFLIASGLSLAAWCGHRRRLI